MATKHESSQNAPLEQLTRCKLTWRAGSSSATRQRCAKIHPGLAWNSDQIRAARGVQATRAGSDWLDPRRRHDSIREPDFDFRLRRSLSRRNSIKLMRLVFAVFGFQFLPERAVNGNDNEAHQWNDETDSHTALVRDESHQR